MDITICNDYRKAKVVCRNTGKVVVSWRKEYKNKQIGCMVLPVDLYNTKKYLKVLYPKHPPYVHDPLWTLLKVVNFHKVVTKNMIIITVLTEKESDAVWHSLFQFKDKDILTLHFLGEGRIRRKYLRKVKAKEYKYEF